MSGRRILIVEDDYFIADDLARGLARLGIDVIGPVSTLAQAFALVGAQRIDAALLDINLDGEKVYELADALIARAVPIAFTTGYDAGVVPDRLSDVPLYQKPIDMAIVLAALGQAAR